MAFNSLLGTLYDSIQGVWFGFISFIPSLVAAIIVFVVGVIIAIGLGSLVEKIVAALKIDMALERLGVKEFFDRAGFKMNTAWFIGKLVYWLILLAFLLAVVNILGLNAVALFLNSILMYLPHLIVAALVLIAALLIGNVLSRVAKGFFVASGFQGASFVATFVRWAVLIFGIWAALLELQLQLAFLFNVVMIGFMAMLALAGGLAFGLGGRDYAMHLLEKMRKQMEGHHE